MSAATRTVRRALIAGRRLGLPALPVVWRQRLVTAAAALLALSLVYLLLGRDLPVFQVDRVTITGLTSDDAPRIRAALESEADEMTTLHVRRDRLEHAVDGYPVVRGLDVSSDFPHGLRVHVIEHHPAALVASGRSRVPVAADGSVLHGLPVKAGSLPLVTVPGALPADQVRHEATLDLLRVAGGAPAVLRSRLRAVKRERERGIVVPLEQGPELVFGEATRVREKWAAALRVLAEDASQGASYVDVRLPDRPAAGGLSVDTIEPTEPALAYPQP